MRALSTGPFYIVIDHETVHLEKLLKSRLEKLLKPR